jgi:hypothetical protein
MKRLRVLLADDHRIVAEGLHMAEVITAPSSRGTSSILHANCCIDHV